MLFSELNRINLNVLLQDPEEYEVVPDISADCYVHNREDWTLFVKEHFEEDETVVDLSDNSTVVSGWCIHDLHGDNIEDRYLDYALREISRKLIDKTEVGSDIVRIYAGKFDIDGTLNYDAIVSDDNCAFHPRDPIHFFPHRGAWWTFNNGAFQWCNGGPKSIFECRFSYGPFSGFDPHHFDNNKEMFDRFHSLSILQNLVFVFDERHVLKGIVSLPCGNPELKNMTKNFIEGFLNYANQKYSMTFKNIDNILKEYSQKDGYIPAIKIASRRRPEPKPENKPVVAIFDITEKTQEIIPDMKFKYILPNRDTMSMFLGKSKWKSYRIDMSLHIPSVDPIGKFNEPPYDPLTEDSTMEDIENHVNDLQGAVTQMYGQFMRYNLITTLSEQFICKPLEGERTTAMLTIAELFKNAKLIRKMKADRELDFRIIVLPENFCNKETLNFITNVRYP